ncbi:MAG: LysR family transcriptional regulator [Pygmaiobacter massiliensis]|nr:LysR family transcriptional regulator [Pygmaiobacter massiliensis]
MEIKHLEFFATVAQYGSINKAAQVLYISQPHLSHIIRDMESDLGFPLFSRTKQGVLLTPEGAAFLEHSKVIIKEMYALKQFARKVQPSEDRLSISMTKFTHTMESFNEVCSRNQQLPSFTYRMNEGTTVDVVNDVAEGIADVGVIHFAGEEAARLPRVLKEKQLSFTHIASLAPHIVISKNHELLRLGKKVNLSNLKPYGFVRVSGQYEDFLYHIAAENHQVDLNNSPRIIYVYGRAALLHLISISNFYTIGIQNFSTQDSMYQCVSIPVENCQERIGFGIITRQGDVLSSSEQEFIKNVTERYHQLQNTP